MPQTIETDELLSRVIKIAEGRRSNDQVFRTHEFTVDTFVARYFTDFERGQKNGTCILQGGLATGSGRRLGKNMDANYILMLDHDSGETMDEVAEKIERAGLTAVLWHTHSHLSTRSEIIESAFIKFRDDNGIEDEIECAKRYLLERKHVIPAIADSVEDVEKSRNDEDGSVVYSITHAPMHKLRSLYILETPFEFVAEGMTQQDRMNEWKSRYRGFAEKLGVDVDSSTGDPARLMYTPRIGRDADRNNYEIRMLDGGTVTLDDMPLSLSPADRLREERRLAADMLREFGIANDTRPGTSFKTPGLGRFLKKYGRGFAASQWLASHTDVCRQVDVDKAEYECPFSGDHSEQDKPGGSAFFATDSDLVNETSWTMQCRHSGCMARTQQDRAAYLDAACQKFGVAHADELINYVDHELRELVNVDPDFLTDRGGTPLPSKYRNFQEAANHMGLTFDYDVFTNEHHMRNFDARPDLGTRIDDELTLALWAHWAETYAFEPAVKSVITFVTAAAGQRRYDSLMDWVNALPAWDGTPRMEHILTYSAPVTEEDIPVIEECTRIFMLGLISRALDPGCKFDYLLVIEGAQGIRKSTFLRELMPNPEWFSDSMSLQDDEKKIMEQTGGKWLLEIPELTGIHYSDFNKIKASLTRRVDRSRMAFQYKESQRPRRFVVAATTNDSEYLRDTTGNRRYLPVRVTGQIDVDRVVAIRDQVFAEALHRYRQGERAIPRDDMLPLLEAAQAARMEANEFSATLEPVFANVAGWVGTEDVYKVLGIEKGKDNSFAQKRAKAAMKQLGYEVVKCRVAGRLQRVFVRLPADWGRPSANSLNCVKPDGTESILPQITINEFAGNAVGGLPVNEQGDVVPASEETKVVTGLFGKRAD